MPIATGSAVVSFIKRIFTPNGLLGEPKLAETTQERDLGRTPRIGASPGLDFAIHFPNIALNLSLVLGFICFLLCR
jgi:hypothetical protein